ncbi:Xaa-Pro dipeptidyl-peptidase [soil metagenome]
MADTVEAGIGTLDGEPRYMTIPLPRLAALLAAAALLLSLLSAGPSAAATQVEVRYVPTVGDAVIRVEIARDADAGSSQPVLLSYSPYNTLGDTGGDFLVANDGLARRYNPMGIARAVGDVLGTRGSTGCWDYGGPDEQQSGVDLVNFLAGDTPDVDGRVLDWSNGRVAMTGVSYDGTTASMVAAAGGERHADGTIDSGAPGLKAVIPVAAISHWYGYAFHDGMRYFLNSESPTDEGFDTPLLFDVGFSDTVHPDNALEGIIAHSDGDCGAVEHTMQAYSRTPDYTDFWLERDYQSPEAVARWRAAALIVHGWNDYNVKQDEAIRLYEALPVDDPETPEVERVPEKRLWMTQARHADGSGEGYLVLRDAFLRTHLLGDADAADQLASIPPVRTQGERGQVVFDTQWPLTDTRQHTLFLNRTYEQDIPGVTVPGPGTGEVGELSYENRPTGPLEGRAGAYGSTSGWLDTGLATEEISRNDPWSNDGNPGPEPGGQGYYSLAFATPPVAANTQIAGRAVLDGVFNVLPVPGAALTPILVEITPTDTYRTIQRGFLNLDYRQGRQSRAPTPNGWIEASVTFLPEDYTVAAGNRIGVILQSSNNVWALPGTPAGFVSVGLGGPSQRPSDAADERGTVLHLPVVGGGEDLFGG